jgi:hypothetical protein
MQTKSKKEEVFFCCLFASSVVSLLIFVVVVFTLLSFWLSFLLYVFASFFSFSLFFTSLLFLHFPLHINFFLVYVCLHLVLSFPQVKSCFPATLPHAEPTVCCNYKCAGMELFSEARKTKFVPRTGQFGQAIISTRSH